MLSPYFVTILSVLGLVVGSPVADKRARKLQFMGVNLAGPEFGTAIPGTYNRDYIWPDLSTIQEFVNQGFNVFRINIMMERLTPGSLTASFDRYYLSNLTQTVNAITATGAYAMINPHNYGRFNGQTISSASDFGTWWKNVAAQYKNNDKVIFDTNNEYANRGSLIRRSITLIQYPDSGA